jgi:hypothetical protein
MLTSLFNDLDPRSAILEPSHSNSWASLICLACKPETAHSSTFNGLLREAVRSNRPSCTVFPKTVLDHASENRGWLADHNIPKPNIIVLTGYSATNPHNQPQPQPFETREQLGRHPGSRYRASHSGWKAGNNDVVYSGAD